MATIQFTVENDDGDEESHALPGKYEVCDRCEGHGTHLHPAIGEHAYTAEEFAESFDDEEREEYFRHGGRYDVTCEECRGVRVVLVVDEEACKSPEQRAALELYWEKGREEAEYEQLCAAERRMGC